VTPLLRKRHAGSVSAESPAQPSGFARRGFLPSDADYFDVTMMTFPGGMERTEPEFRSLFKQSGFELTRVVPTTSMANVVEGRPA